VAGAARPLTRRAASRRAAWPSAATRRAASAGAAWRQAASRRATPSGAASRRGLRRGPLRGGPLRGRHAEAIRRSRPAERSEAHAPQARPRPKAAMRRATPSRGATRKRSGAAGLLSAAKPARRRRAHGRRPPREAIRRSRPAERSEALAPQARPRPKATALKLHDVLEIEKHRRSISKRRPHHWPRAGDAHITID
jgi:hypothetical protein